MEDFLHIFGSHPEFGLGLLLFMLGLAVVFDLRQRRIPNWLILAGLVSGLVAHLLANGGWGGVHSLGGATFLLLACFPLFAIGWLGAGDVKLLAAVGAFVTWHYALPVLVAVALMGGVLGVAAMIWKAGLGQLWQRIGALVGFSLATRRPPALTDSTSSGVELPYAIAIGLGTLASVPLASLLPVLVL